MARLEEWLPRARRRKASRVHRIRLIGLLCQSHYAKKPARLSNRAGFFLVRSARERPAARVAQAATISNECVISAVLAIMIDAEQYLSCDRLIARSTVAGFRFLPVTVK